MDSALVTTANSEQDRIAFVYSLAIRKRTLGLSALERKIAV